MQQDASLPRPPTRSRDNNSPGSATGSDWSGMSGHNGNHRPDAFPSLAKGDSISPYDSNGNFDPRSFHRANTFAGMASEPMDNRRGPSENGSYSSRPSSRAASSRTSDISLRDPQSRRYARAESELRQHYAVLRAYLKGNAAQPPRANKAKDKLLRLSPVQFHELSTDVFDELQRRQAAAPLPGRPPRQDKVPPFLQPRPDYHEKRNQARQKLSSLQTSRFRDLSTDVFCELERRFPHFNPDNRRESTRSQRARSQSRGQGSRPPPPPNGMPYPGGPGPNGFRPPSRAHTAHGSISSQMGPRKGSVEQYEMPQNPMGDYARPTPKQFHSNMAMPNKSTMVEDEDDQEINHLDGYDRSSDAFGLDSSVASPRSRRDTSATSMTNGSRDVKSIPPPSEEVQEKITSLEHQLHMKDLEIRELSGHATLQQELQGRLDQAENLNQSLRDEIEKMRQEHDMALSQRQSSSVDRQLQDDHTQLQEEHQKLRSRYEQQLQTTADVSKQFKAQLAEIRALANESAGSIEREEKLHTEVQRLREEAAEWKARYTRTKTQLRDVRVSTLGLTVPGMNGARAVRDETFFSQDGLIRDVHMTKFQLSIDGLLHTARTDQGTGVVDHMKEVVIAVRSITGDVEVAGEGDKKDEATKKRNKLKGKVTATANNVITASKNYAAAQGLSPVSLLDAAASHLTAAVVDLARYVKIRPSPPGELAVNDDEHMTPINKNGYFHTNDDHVRRPSAAESVYSALSDPPPEQESRTPLAANQEFNHPNNGGFSGLGIDASRQDDVDLEEFKIYLGNQTDVLVQTIQALVGAVRNGQQMPVIRDHVGGILDLVDNILNATEASVGTPSSFNDMLEAKAVSPFQSLVHSKNQLEQATQEMFHHEGQPTAKDFAQRLPPLAFQIAREAKGLIAKVEEVIPGQHVEAEDFS